MVLENDAHRDLGAGQHAPDLWTMKMAQSTKSWGLLLALLGNNLAFLSLSDEHTHCLEDRVFPGAANLPTCCIGYYSPLFSVSHLVCSS